MLKPLGFTDEEKTVSLPCELDVGDFSSDDIHDATWILSQRYLGEC
jgi:hypothetical protein